MMWTILIKIDDATNAFKFWSHDDGMNQVAWGRIGTQGQTRAFTPEYIQRKAREKMNEGYREMGFGHDSPSPSPEDAREFWDRVNRRWTIEERQMSSSLFSEMTSSMRAEEERQRQERNDRYRTPIDDQEEEARNLAERQRQERSRSEQAEDIEASRQPGRRERTVLTAITRTHHVPDVDVLKTDDKGYISNYRRDYQRNVFDEYISFMTAVKVSDLTTSSLTPINPNSARFKEAVKYFKKIPASSQYDKPEHFYELREIHRPTFACVFFEKGRKVECVSIFGVNKTLNICEFLALKSNAQYRRNLLKKILLNIANSLSGEGVIFQLKSKSMIKEIKDIMPVVVRATPHVLEYYLVDIRTGISLPNQKPARWIE